MAQPRAVWSGTLAFALVNIPVRMYPAISEKDVRFHQFADGRRVRYRRVTRREEPPLVYESPPGSPGEPDRPGGEAGRPELAAERSREPDEAPAPPRSQEQASKGETEVPYDRIVKGYQVEPGRYVMVTSDELERLRPARDRTIEIQDFVDLRAIDPVHFERSYLLAPAPGAGAERPYALLLRAMAEGGKVGIARFVFRTRAHLCAVRPRERAIGLETLYYADEVRAVADVFGLPATAEASQRELRVARDLIDVLSTDWVPERYTDPDRERVMDLIGSRAAEAGFTEPGVAAEPPGEESRVADLIEALRRSVEGAKRPRGRTEGGPAQPPRVRRERGRRRTG